MHCKYNLISVWFNKISKRFPCVWGRKACLCVSKMEFFSSMLFWQGYKKAGQNWGTPLQPFHILLSFCWKGFRVTLIRPLWCREAPASRTITKEISDWNAESSMCLLFAGLNFPHKSFLGNFFKLAPCDREPGAFNHQEKQGIFCFKWPETYAEMCD